MFLCLICFCYYYCHSDEIEKDLHTKSVTYVNCMVFYYEFSIKIIIFTFAFDTVIFFKNSSNRKLD